MVCRLQIADPQAAGWVCGLQILDLQTAGVMTERVCSQVVSRRLKGVTKEIAIGGCHSWHVHKTSVNAFYVGPFCGIK